MIVGNKFDKDNKELNSLDLEKYTSQPGDFMFY
jgi:hypothetical protein